MLELVVGGGPVFVGWPVVLVLAAVSNIGALSGSEHPVNVDSGEDAVVGDSVVLGCRLESVQVREAGSISLTQDEGHEGVTVVDAIDVFALQELEDVVLHDGVLVNSGSLSAGSLETNCVAKGEDIVEAVVLEGVLVNIDESIVVCEAGILDPLVGLGWRVDVSTVEIFFNNLTGVDISEVGNLLSVRELGDLDHLPAEHNFDSALVALIKSNLVSVGELVDLLVGGPVLNTCVGGGAAIKDVHSLEVLVVKSVEISTLTLVWELGRVANGIAMKVSPAVVEVALSSVLAIHHVHEDVVLLVALLHLIETLNRLDSVVETGSQNESLVGESLSVGELQGIVVGVETDELGTCFNL